MVDALNAKQKSAIERAKRSVELQPILFREAKGIRWFDAFKEAGFLDPKAIPAPVPSNKAGYVNIPIWPITEYIVAASEDLVRPEHQMYARHILDFIRTATAEAKSKGISNYRVWWKFAKIMPNIPDELLTPRDFAMVDYWLEDPYDRGMVASVLGGEWLTSLLAKNDSCAHSAAVNVLGLLFKVTVIEKKPGDPSSKELFLRVDSWHARELIKRIGIKVGTVLGTKAVDIFHQALDMYLTAFNRDTWSSVWRRAIEDHEQNSSASDADDIIVEGYRDSMLGLTSRGDQEAIDFAKKLLVSKFDTVKRIAVYAVDRNYDMLRSLIDMVIVETNFSTNLRHELWHLLANHFAQFTLEQKERVLAIIAGLSQKDDKGVINEGAIAYKRAIWLAALKDSDSIAKTAYERDVETVGGEPENPDFSSYMKSGWVTHKSPYPADELLTLEPSQLVERLNSYQDTGDFLGPNAEGLAKAVREAVLAQPVRIGEQLGYYTGLKMPYMNELIDAYVELWGKNTDLPWDKLWVQLLRFCNIVVNNPKFWAETEPSKTFHLVANRRGVVDTIGRLIENGVRDDAHAFSPELMPLAEEIITVLLSKERGSEFKLTDDAVNVAINSPRGRCLEALINLTLRACRLADATNKEHKAAWKRFEATYDNELVLTKSSQFEFVTLAAMYIPQFLYMSKDWIISSLPRIFDTEHHQVWLCAMQGYSYVSSPTAEIYEFLRDKGHFLRALDDTDLKDKVIEKVIQNICVAYLYDRESLDDPASLISILLQRHLQDELHQLVWFLWTIRKQSDEKLIGKVLRLWPRLLAVIDPKTEEGRQLLAELSDWSIFVEKMDTSTKKLILASTPYAGAGYHSHVLMQSIARFSESQPDDAYDIWMEVLKSGNPDYPPDAVYKALENLSKNGTQGMQKAKRVAGEYIKIGNQGPMKWLKTQKHHTQ
ncbi:MAG: hypothetical protein ACRESX_01255 [Gammaproteobacteria bacterium]